MRSPPSQPYSARTLYPPELEGRCTLRRTALVFPKTRTLSKRPLVWTLPVAQPCVRPVSFAATTAQTSGRRWAPVQQRSKYRGTEYPENKADSTPLSPLDVIPRQPPIFQPPSTCESPKSWRPLHLFFSYKPQLHHPEPRVPTQDLWTPDPRALGIASR